jgi:hypothetical protein
MVGVANHLSASSATTQRSCQVFLDPQVGLMMGLEGQPTRRQTALEQCCHDPWWRRCDERP